MAKSSTTSSAADALYAHAVGATRDNGSVRLAELTPKERDAFAKIARENGNTGDAVADSLVDAGVSESKARSFAAEMRKRENAGVTALAFALPNPAGPRSVPPDLSAIRSTKMAIFTGGKKHKKRDNKSKKRDNRSESRYIKLRKFGVDAGIPAIATQPKRVAAESLDPGSLTPAQVANLAEAYLSGGDGRVKKWDESTRTLKGKGANIVRNAFALALANMQTEGPDGRPAHVALIPYTGPIGGKGTGGGGIRNVDVGPNTTALLLQALKSPKVTTGRKGGGAKGERGQANVETFNLAQTLMAQAQATGDAKLLQSAQLLLAAATAGAPKSVRKAVNTKRAQNRNARVSAIQTALASNQPISAGMAKKILKAFSAAGDANSPLAAAYIDLKGKDLAEKLRENRSRRKRDNRSRRHGIMRDNRFHIARKRDNVSMGGLNVKSIGFGVLGGVAGVAVGVLATDGLGKIPMVGKYLPYAGAAFVGWDAFQASKGKGMLFKKIDNVGLRYGLAGGLIFAMVARGSASWLLRKLKLGMIDGALGRKAGAAGFGDIYDTAFEDISGTGEYLAENGVGEYLAESGMGEYLAESGMGEYLAENGLGEYLAESGLGTEVMAAPAGFGSDEDAAGELDASDLDGFGEIDPALVRQFAGFGAEVTAASAGLGGGVTVQAASAGLGGDDEDEDMSLEGLGELTDQDLSLEGLGDVADARASGTVESVQRAAPSSIPALAAQVNKANRANNAKLFDMRIVGRSRTVPGTLIVAITRSLGSANLPATGGITKRSSTTSIPRAPAGQATFRPGGIFAETVFGGRGFGG